MARAVKMSDVGRRVVTQHLGAEIGGGRAGGGAAGSGPVAVVAGPPGSLGGCNLDMGIEDRHLGCGPGGMERHAGEAHAAGPAIVEGLIVPQ